MSGILRCGAWAFFDRRVLGGLQKAKMDTAIPPVPLQFQWVVIGLCKRKETAALKIKAAVSNGRVKLSAVRRLFSFAVVRQNGLVIISERSPLLLV